jgi:hypothetical protein
MFSHNSTVIEESGHPRYEQEAPVVFEVWEYAILVKEGVGW